MDHLPGVEVVVEFPRRILLFLWSCIKGIGFILWTCLKYIGYGIAAVFGTVARCFVAAFEWIADWNWSAIGDFFVSCITLPFKAAGWVFQKTIVFLKWFFETFAEVLVWLIKFMLFYLTLQFLFKRKDNFDKEFNEK